MSCDQHPEYLKKIREKKIAIAAFCTTSNFLTSLVCSEKNSNKLKDSAAAQL